MKLLAACAALAILTASLPAFAQETRLRSARVSADDVQKTATFYQTTFGLRDIRHVDRDGKLFEIIMNYGATAKEAEESKATKLVVILRGKDAPAPSVSNLVFEVKDLDAIIARATGSGGVVSRATTKSATSGSRIAFVRDPSGNEIELIEPPKG
jgi:predicted enzyme related to lactoylglutathione lyase